MDLCQLSTPSGEEADFAREEADFEDADIEDTDLQEALNADFGLISEDSEGSQHDDDHTLSVTSPERGEYRDQQEDLDHCDSEVKHL